MLNQRKMPTNRQKFSGNFSDAARIDRRCKLRLVFARRYRKRAIRALRRRRRLLFRLWSASLGAVAYCASAHICVRLVCLLLDLLVPTFCRKIAPLECSRLVGHPFELSRLTLLAEVLRRFVLHERLINAHARDVLPDPTKQSL